MRLDRIPSKKTIAILGKVFENIVKKSEYTLIADENFNDAKNAIVVNGRFGVKYFAVKELPKFNFAVWMANINKIGSGRYAWNYFVFGAHENDWDKFNPTSVRCKTTGYIILDEDLNPIPDNFQVNFVHDELFDYIKKEPYLARYREHTFVDYNFEYVSRRTAKRYIRKLDKAREKKAKIEMKQANKLIKRCSKELSKEFEKVYLLEHSNAAPRYEFIVSKQQDGDFSQSGFYGYFDFTKKDQKPMSDYEVSYNIQYIIPEEFLPFIKKVKKNKSYTLTQIK